MSDSFAIQSVLFVQKPDVLEAQRQRVQSVLSDALPGVRIVYASAPEQIPDGTRVDVIITPTLGWLPAVLQRVRGYRWIHFLSAGVEKIWAMDFEKDGLLLSKSSGVNSAPMSEYALGAMLFFAKRFGQFQAQGRNGLWQREWLGELTGQTVAILGLGHVGRAVAAKASAFDMQVVGTLRQPREIAGVERIVPPERSGELLGNADYLVVCLPLTSRTLAFVNDELLGMLKPGAILIDMSRGGVVKAGSVLRALDQGRLRGAALDVFETQPLPANSPLWGRSDILVTPHVSGTTPYYLERALAIFMDNVVALRETGKLRTPVSVEERY